MGTRADFYIGRGVDAQWLGSIAWDGYPTGIVSEFDSELFNATTPEEFASVTAERLATREDGTTPEMGWPWPWTTSHTTDYAYAFDDGQVWACCSGGAWAPAKEWFNADDSGDRDFTPEGEPAIFPDMSEQKNVALGSRSGVIFVRPKSDG